VNKTTSSNIHYATLQPRWQAAKVQLPSKCLKQRIDALKSTLEQQLQQLEKGMKKWMEEKSVPQPTVKQEDLRSLVRDCVHESTLVTNTPASAVHGKSAVQKGIY
jgi:FKBP-type peptidyl-prolyl cis-trans isomerase (trigger factor)